MGTSEKQIINQVLMTLPPTRRLFRINAGMGWAGKIVKKYKSNGRERIIIENPYPFRAAPQGWPDLSGWQEVKITPDMVGKKVAVFTGIEVKASGRLSTEQSRLKKLIEKMGGIYEIVRG